MYNPDPDFIATTLASFAISWVFLIFQWRSLGVRPLLWLNIIFAMLAVATAFTIVYPVHLRSLVGTIIVGVAASLVYSPALVRLFARYASVNTPAAKTAETIQVTPAPIPAPSRVIRQGKVFICYRRDDSADITGRIYDGLVRHFGRESVFKDVDSIPYGVDFRKTLEQSVQQCDAMLVVIGRTWLSSGREDTRQRLDDQTDFVRIEIEAAIKRDIPIIPILVQEATVPRPESLPLPIQDLAYRNGLSVRRDPDFHNDLARLISAVEGIFGKR